ncbi:MAG TPA: amidase family protein [Gemmatimonadaceae bacterium]|nr:amidase family protein [Gemmatimonadaceae bacterium]
MRGALAGSMLLAAAASGAGGQGIASRKDPVHETSIVELQAEMTAGRMSALQLVDLYLARIAAYDHQGPSLNAVISLNPRARADASALDEERRAGRVRGPLHGIPVLIKDNYATVGMPTTGGSIALAGFVTGRDAFQVARLRAAGAVILGKTNMHELASGVTNASSLGGQTCNPYDPARIPGGSSGGTGAAIAASFAAIGWGSDTCGSIRIPAASNNLFGLRPTKGLSSIAGIIPLSHTQDVAGPLARTVTDLAIGLDATIGADPDDAATRLVAGRPPVSFVGSLDANALRGARIGVLASMFGNQPEDQEAATIVRAALDRMKSAGATIVEVSIPGLDTLIQRAGVIDHEFKFDFMDFMAAFPDAPVRTLDDVINRGLYHQAIDASIRRRNAVAARTSPQYGAALARRDVARRMVEAFLDSAALDGVAYPTVRRKPTLISQPQPPGNCQLSAVTGLPAMAMPAGFTADSLPIGLEILGRTLSDTRLVALAFSYEQAAQPRRSPRLTPALTNPPARIWRP